MIPQRAAFKRAALQACRLAAQEAAIVMLGVNPDAEPKTWTGFGTLRVDGATVTQFAEKPSLAQAAQMIQEGAWQWNSGMFFFRISTAEAALARFQPAMHATYQTLCQAVARGQTTRAKKI